MTKNRFLGILSPLAVMIASCGAAPSGDNAAPGARSPGTDGTDGTAGTPGGAPFAMREVATFEEPWAMAFDKGSGALVVTERKGAIRFVTADGQIGTVTGAPKVDYGGQGGLGDFRFAPGQTSKSLDGRTVYLTWAEAGQGDTRGAALGRARMACPAALSCRLEGLEVIWRQQPKVDGRGHYSHRIAFSPDGRHLFLASGERQKMDPAQDLSNTLGKVLRLLPDGSPAPGNPFAARGSPADEIWSYGHRNILGLAFDGEGRLWDLEHGPAGGDELNLVRPGANYGWPLTSDGDHYDGRPIPRHSDRPQFAAPAISWNPVIAPGDMIFHSGPAFADWNGQVLIAAMKPAALVRVAIDGTGAREVARYPMEHRIRDIEQAPDGTVWVIEDGKDLPRSRLLKLTPSQTPR